MSLKKLAVCVFVVALSACADEPTAPGLSLKPQFDQPTTHEVFKTENSGIIPNPCTGEDIEFSGGVHVNVMTWEEGTAQHLKGTAHTSNFRAVGLTSGIEYRLVEVLHVVQDAILEPPFPATAERDVVDVWVAQGSADNLVGHSMLTFTFDGTNIIIEIKKMELECQG